jgi:hypothetical protein
LKRWQSIYHHYGIFFNFSWIFRIIFLSSSTSYSSSPYKFRIALYIVTDVLTNC